MLYQQELAITEWLRCPPADFLHTKESGTDEIVRVGCTVIVAVAVVVGIGEIGRGHHSYRFQPLSSFFFLNTFLLLSDFFHPRSRSISLSILQMMSPI